ncbi:hypothetical protein PP914_gp186 [Arthrobacter phage Qui]|uniref:Uncharacterized protein n=1 Tax=Arthrobacter phage Qui TaxID=2603260 RepID=A0A5B8WG29_9CAUD|nr:hypothetical protein PP914_gp186 [Arthrobacter phage Qui]QED11674.1 hypothetical protein SEA_QUI_186 [Arthrobacter phage Qui]QOC56505.1 hypothetical protein SEA_PAELLA_186 [Arthrobacter phage Paella]
MKPREVILKVLAEHSQSARNRRCRCGWRPTWPDDRFGAEYLQFNDHFADEMVKALVEANLTPNS